jgi:hypothetical protein
MYRLTVTRRGSSAVTATDYDETDAGIDAALRDGEARGVYDSILWTRDTDGSLSGMWVRQRGLWATGEVAHGIRRQSTADHLAAASTLVVDL